eukprot:3301045-Lingulodinium_polyedra.AAC.1
MAPRGDGAPETLPLGDGALRATRARAVAPPAMPGRPVAPLAQPPWLAVAAAAMLTSATAERAP